MKSSLILLFLSVFLAAISANAANKTGNQRICFDAETKDIVLTFHDRNMKNVAGIEYGDNDGELDEEKTRIQPTADGIGTEIILHHNGEGDRIGARSGAIRVYVYFGSLDKDPYRYDLEFRKDLKWCDGASLSVR